MVKANSDSYVEGLDAHKNIAFWFFTLDQQVIVPV